jgi:hypothetical protein
MKYLRGSTQAIKVCKPLVSEVSQDGLCSVELGMY